MIAKYDLIPMVDNEEIVHCINKHAAEDNKVINIHIKINTGLNRYVITPDETKNFIQRINKNCNNITVEGIYSHFQNPDYDPGFTKKQINLFSNIVDQLNKENIRPKIVHLANSSGTIKYSESHFDMVRCGSILYGLAHEEGEVNLPKGIKSLITFKSHIIKIQSVKTGESGGYGTNFIAKKDSTVAIVGAGYGDGISRGLKEVLIGGKKVPVVNYFMDSLMLDITDLKEEIHEFDEVVIVGSQGDENISWLDACKKLGSYTDEQIQRITKRVPRIYFYE
jgi:alanine racemase